MDNNDSIYINVKNRETQTILLRGIYSSSKIIKKNKKSTPIKVRRVTFSGERKGAWD